MCSAVQLTRLNDPDMKRFLSLDIFRGLTVACMILVNNPGSYKAVFGPLRHRPWDGCTPTDLVFPFFLFIVGAAIWFSMRKTDHRLTPSVAGKVLRRGALIFLVGLLLNWFPFYDFNNGAFRGFESLRILGVLQRIALAFVGGAFLALWLGSYRRIMIGTAVLLLGYWGIMTLFGDLTLEGNAALRFDRMILGENHLYKGYGLPFDPEGLLSTIPAICNVLIGYMAGRLMGEAEGKEGIRKSLTKMVAWGMVLVATALLWNTVLPINKPIWSSSYVLYTCGLAMLVWAALSYIIDYEERTRWTTFFRVFGTNALFAYVLSSVLAKCFGLPFFRFTVGGTTYTLPGYLTSLYTSLTTPHIGSLLWALTLVGICWVITWLLYRKRIFIKL